MTHTFVCPPRLSAQYACAVDEVLEFVLAVKAAHREINRRFAMALRPLDITVAQAEAILVLAESQPLSLKELGAHVVAEAGNPSRLVDRLVTAGLVRRRVALDDRRNVQLTLTTQGRKLAQRIHQAREPLREWGGRQLNGNGLDAMTASLQQLVDNHRN